MAGERGVRRLALRPPAEAADDRLLTLVRRPEVAGEFNWFDDPPEERLGIQYAPAGRLVVALSDGTPIGTVGWLGVPYGPNRVEADCDVTNVAEQRALEAAGFRREGVVRGAQFRAGRWHDLLMYSILRSDG
jgi:hypothetical protein